MANITLTTTDSNIVVDATNDIINVTSTPTTIVVAQGTGLDVPGVRTSISNIAPILYNSTTGVISFDANAAFSGKTTDDLAQGVSNIYFSTTGAAVNTTNLPEGANLYFTDARVLTAINTGNVTLKKYQETYLNAGTTNGNVALDAAQGTIQQITLNGDLTGLNLSNLSIGGSFTLLIKQDSFGSRLLNTTSGWGTWIFANNLKTLSAAPNAVDLLTFTYDGTNYFASLVPFGATFIPNSQLANSNVIVNGTTINLGSSGNISHFGALTTTNLPEGANLYFTATRVRSNVSGASLSGISYDSTSGTFSLVNIPNSSLTNSAITINGTAVALGGTRTLTTTDIAEGTNLYFTAARANSNVVSHIGTVPLTVGGNLTVNGNINATGNINVQNVEDLYVRDQTIVMNANAASPANVQIVSNRPGFANTEIKWNEQSDRWTFTNDGTTYYNLATSTSDVAEGTNLYYTTDRANTAIDTRVNKAFVEGLGVSYTSLANTPTNVSFFTNDAGYLVAANLASLTANVNSVNGATGVVVLDTDDISEGSANLYFTTARANTAIDDYVAGSENIDVTSGVISLTNALGNVNSITTSASTNLTVNTNNKLAITQNFSGRQLGFSGNIVHDGYAYFTGGSYTGNAVTSYSGTANIEGYIFDTGTTTVGSNAITGVSILEYWDETPVSLSNLSVNYLFVRESTAADSYPFPNTAYITSVDSANSTVYMSENATANLSLTIGTTIYVLRPALIDSETKQAILLASQYDANISPRSKTVIQGSSPFPLAGKYGYPSNGWINTDFDIVTAGLNTEYTLGNLSNKFIGRNSLAAPTTALQAPRGLIVGNGDLTGRAENDVFPAFGINILWDGLTTSADYAGNPPSTQLLLKQYSDNSSGALQGDRNGPRLFFTTARGNRNQSFSDTYPRVNNELGRISWWGATGTTSAPSSIAPPAYINSMVLQDYATHNGGTGLYFVASPHTDASRRGLFAAHHLGNTVITSSGSTNTGASQPITFAPMITALTNNATNLNTSSNSLAMYNNTMAANNYQWAYINYNDATAKTGSKLTITNGVSTVAGRNGNLVIALDRNDNGVGFGNKEWALKLQPGSTSLVLTEDDVIRTTFAGANITTAGNISASTFLGNLNGTSATLSGNATVTGNVNLGTNATINYDSVFGEFYNTANVTAAAADTVYALEWPNVHVNTNRVTVTSNSQINIGQEGNYTFMVELQAVNTDNAVRTAFLWLAKNGTDIADTAVKIGLRPATIGTTHQLISKMWLAENLLAGDYVEVRFAVDNISGISLEATAAQASPYARPAIPSAVITVTPVGV